MKKFIFIFLFIFFTTSAFALDVVYPNSNNVVINSPTTFFIGSSNPYKLLKINSKVVNVHNSGGFAHVVELNIGKNVFNITSGNQTLTYIINRNQLKCPKTCKTFIPYSTKKSVLVLRDNVPLRSTPIEEGVNRLSHLDENVTLITDGEQGNLYRVLLENDLFAWVSKNDVKPSPLTHQPVKIKKITSVYDKDFCYYKFHLSERTPYTVEEGNPIVLKIFNTTEKKPTAGYYLFLTHELLGYDAYYSGNELIFKIRKKLEIDKCLPLKNVKIVLDAGHGGKENGTTGCLGTREKEFNLEITKLLQKELEARGAKVLLTRDTDKYMSLSDRVKYTKSHDAEIFLSIHANALPDNKNPNDYRGASIYYYYPQAKPLAQSILCSMSKEIVIDKAEPIQASFAVIRNSSALSLLIETAYAINPEDNALLMSDEFKQKCAQTITEGIEQYLIRCREVF